MKATTRPLSAVGERGRGGDRQGSAPEGATGDRLNRR
jgi:hypothetical protein